MECTCRFYKLDQKEKEEFEKFCTTLPFDNDKLPDIPSEVTGYEYGCSILSVCTNFCKHLKITGAKDPVPYSYCCCAAGNEHIIYSPQGLTGAGGSRAPVGPWNISKEK